GRVVSEIQKEWLPRPRCSLVEIVNGPRGEEIRRMPRGINDSRVVTHIVVSLPAMRRIAVHHVAEKAVKEIKPALVRRVGAFETQIPLADEGRRVTDLAQLICQSRRGWIQIAPRVRGLGSNDAGHSDAVGKSAGQ